MIRPLRARHRHAFVALALLLPAGFAAGLLAREPRRTSDLVERIEPADGAPQHGRSIAVDEDAFGDVPIALHLSESGDRWVVELTTRAPTGLGAPLVYWTRTAPGADELPADAQLLGAPGDVGRSVRWSVPLTGAPDGHLILFDLARGETAAAVRLGR